MAKQATADADAESDVAMFSDELNKALRGARLGATSKVDLFTPGSSLPDTMYIRKPIGMPILDKPAGMDVSTDVLGGMADGETMLILGRPGSGKTILASGIAWSVVRTGRRAVYLSYENRLSGGSAGDMVARFYSMATGESKNLFMNRDLRTLLDEVKAKIKAAKCELLEYMDGEAAHAVLSRVLKGHTIQEDRT